MAEVISHHRNHIHITFDAGDTADLGATFRSIKLVKLHFIAADALSTDVCTVTSSGNTIAKWTAGTAASTGTAELLFSSEGVHLNDLQISMSSVSGDSGHQCILFHK